MRIDYSVAPNRLAVMCAGARAVVELGAAPAQRRDILVGDLLALDPLVEDADEAKDA